MDFQTKCNILGQFWFEYRDDDKLKDFIEYNDVGLPLAWFISTDIVSPNPMAETYVSETFDLFISALEISEDDLDGLDTLEEIFELLDSKQFDQD